MNPMNQKTMSLSWGTCDDPPVWCRLYSLDFNDTYFDNLMGVYIIWYWDQYSNRITVRVGQGEIKKRLQEHRRTYAQAYANVTLYVTWANVYWPSDRDGVENYLGNLLQPGGVYPDVDPISVNLPW